MWALGIQYSSINIYRILSLDSYFYRILYNVALRVSQQKSGKIMHTFSMLFVTTSERNARFSVPVRGFFFLTIFGACHSSLENIYMYIFFYIDYKLSFLTRRVEFFFSTCKQNSRILGEQNFLLNDVKS